MTSSILTTKLYIPPVRQDLIPRHALIERLNEGLHRKLTLVSAPAGFGKTTLLSEWMEKLKLDTAKDSPIENRVAWISLDENDNDPVRFLTYLIAALSRVDGIETTLGEGLVHMLQSPQPPPTEDILTSVINTVSSFPDRIILVFDDFHRIESPPVDEALTFTIENLPPQMHLVIATRVDPQLPLARMRVRNHLTEIRAVDLRFTPSEAAEFLNNVMGLDLSAGVISALETRTEGWIAGLQLAAISLQGQGDTAALVQSFTGSHRFVLDYLVEEVLKQQSENVQNFLLLTSILDRLNGSLGDALTGQDNGQKTLELLERSNLFIVPLDAERQWYRYHHLFADLLQQRLHQTQLELIPSLHHRASEWHAKNGFVDESIEHALLSKNFQRAAHLIEEHVDDLWGRGQHSKLRRWLNELPEEMLFSKPYISIFQARYQCNSGILDEAERTLKAVEEALVTGTIHAPGTDAQQQISYTDTDRAKLRGRAAATRALMCSYQGDVPGIIQHANQALEILPGKDLTWRGLTAQVLGNAHGFKGDMNAAYDARVQALSACQDAGDISLIIVASLNVAITLRDQGLLQRTIEICEQQLELANKHGLSHSSIVGYLLAVWGETLAELNDLEPALEMAEKGYKFAERRGNREMHGWAYMCLVRILFSKGDLAGVEKYTQKMQNVAREYYLPPWITNQMSAWQARLWLKQNKLDAAIQWADERKLNFDGESIALHEIDFFSLFDYVVLARILNKEGRLDETTKLLHYLLTAAESGGRTTKVIEIMILQALTFQEGGEPDRALSVLEGALTLAEPGGFIRIFLDEGQPMTRLLQEAFNRAIAPVYVRRLLEAFSSLQPEQTAATASETDLSGLIEPLSERELEVLALIAEGLTNQEIAARLFLSPNTVKVHTRNIFGKLGVKNRTLAVTRARTLGVLSST